MSFYLRAGVNKFKLLSVSRKMYAASCTNYGKAISVVEQSEDMTRNPYFEKYAEKIRALQKSSPEEFHNRLNESLNRKKPDLKDETSAQRGFSNVMEPKANVCGGESGRRRRKVLDEVMKTQLIEDKSASEITQIWQEYYKSKDGIAAAIPSENYEVMYKRGKQYPLFLLPLPRGQGYEFILLQIDDHEVHFTPLINFQVHKENAPECLTIVHFPELKDKGIVLMHGEFNKDIVDATEAQCLANQFQLYYGKDNDKRLKLLERFNCFPNDFKHMDLIAELECLSL